MDQIWMANWRLREGVSSKKLAEIWSKRSKSKWVSSQEIQGKTVLLMASFKRLYRERGKAMVSSTAEKHMRRR